MNKINDAEFVQQVIDLFYEYREDFGIANDDFPGEFPQQRACEFEDKFCEMICQLKGHIMCPDHCGKPEHDFCSTCMTRRDELEGWIADDFRSKE